MNICLVLDDSIYRPGGAQNYVINLATWFVSQGHQATILFSEDHALTPFELDYRITTIPIASVSDIRWLSINGSVSPLPAQADHQHIKQLLLDNVYDVIAFNYPFSPFVSGKLIRILKRLVHDGHSTKPQLLCTFHIHVEEKMLTRLGNRLLGMYFVNTAKYIDTFIHISEPTQQYGKKYLGVDSIKIPVGVPSYPHITKPQYNSQRKLSVLFLGRLEVRKGVTDLLRAVALLPQSTQDKIIVNIAGDGTEREEAEKMVKTHSLPVTFLGKVSNKERESLLASADLTVFPAKYGESFGIVLIEAMNFSCSIIGYANAGYADTLSTFPDALVPVNDIHALSKRLDTFINSPEIHITKRGIEWKQHFEKHFSMDSVGRKFLQAALK